MTGYVSLILRSFDPYIFSSTIIVWGFQLADRMCCGLSKAPFLLKNKHVHIKMIFLKVLLSK